MATVQERFASLWPFDRVGDRLSWYGAVAANKMPAKYLIARRLRCDVPLDKDEAELWREHDRLEEIFLRLWAAIRRGESHLDKLPVQSPSLMDLKVALSKRMLAHCNFCAWDCRVDRAAGTKHGTCQLESVSRVGSFFHHRGEELVFRGTEGSGTIFFTSCNLRCVFCQNSDISHDKEQGIPVTPRLLSLMAWKLRMEGVHNINFVGGEPTIHLHNIVEAVALLDFHEPRYEELEEAMRAQADAWLPFKLDSRNAFYRNEFNVPILWNSNFYMSPETMRILRTMTDVWLPDLKFGPGKCGIFLSKTPRYWERVTENLRLIESWGEDYVIRHLVMPGHVECCTKPCLDWVAKHAPRALVNVMDQYHPDCATDSRSPNYQERHSSLARRPLAEEIAESYRYAEDLGLRFETVTFEKKGLRL
jgi:putative pyruvate formate lyase activating enzyme